MHTPRWENGVAEVGQEGRRHRRRRYGLWTQYKITWARECDPRRCTSRPVQQITSWEQLLSSFYLYARINGGVCVCTYIANSHDSHFLCLQICLPLKVICNSSINAHWAFTVICGHANGGQKPSLPPNAHAPSCHWTRRFYTFWFHLRL